MLGRALMGGQPARRRRQSANAARASKRPVSSACVSVAWIEHVYRIWSGPCLLVPGNQGLHKQTGTRRAAANDPASPAKGK